MRSTREPTNQRGRGRAQPAYMEPDSWIREREARQLGKKAPTARVPGPQLVISLLILLARPDQSWDRENSPRHH